ncbi:MAG TPA: sugar-transporting ATPase [candidate division Zixibacteria bacterium]|jgi:ribose transport system permease protein|nr:sugar-transporting ATPase [candidate division Zixibacteria bacterium]HBZ00675.1 sugar-transporting ATPase [candidate division Zixibacteria bacterium]
MKNSYKIILSRFLSNYGMLGILIILGILFSILTLRDQYPSGEDAARSLSKVLSTYSHDSSILIISRDTGDDSLFATSLDKRLTDQGFNSIKIISGDPLTVRKQISALPDSEKVSLIATSYAAAPMAFSIKNEMPGFANTIITPPPPYRWPTFLLPDNLRNVANQIAVIAIMAIGMTLVIITAGIDLSVGSLIALSAVVTAWFVGQVGGESATFWGMVLSGLIGIVLCGVIGAFSGLMITRFRIPPFIATLAMMQVAAGFAYVISEGKPIYHLPESFILLGRGAEPFLKIPYAVILMIILYIAAHILMTRTTIGRYVYAVGGNMEAARLAGIRVKRILFFVYMLCGILAGLGGVVMASQLKSGAPTYGLTYELYVIAAVVVGGTSLSGGEGRIFGTLIGAFIIAVIQNGMNLTNVETYTQKIVLGLVILGAVLLDRLKQMGMGKK